MDSRGIVFGILRIILPWSRRNFEQRTVKKDLGFLIPSTLENMRIQS